MGSCWNGVCRTSSTRSWTRWHSHYEYVKIAQNQTWSRVENEKLDGTWWNLCGTSDAFHWQKNKDLCKSRLEPTWGEEFARQGSTDWRPNHGWWENGVAIGALATQAVSRFRIPSWNQPQSFSIYMWQGHDILAKHPIICGRIGMPKPCKSNKGLRTKATSSLFHLSSGVLGLSKQIELSNALRSGSGVALSPALLHDPHDSCRFRWFQVAGL